MRKKILLGLFPLLLCISLIACEPVTEEDPTIYVVTFDAGMGIGVNPMNVEAGTSIDLPTTIWAGHTLLGWTLTDNPSADVLSEPFYPDADVVLYAKWSVNQYVITFQTNGGSTIDPITQDFYTTVIQPEDPVKEDHLFAGWYLDEGLTTAYIFTTMPSQDITLYAKWEEIDWNVVESYLNGQIPTELSDDIDLPSTYLDYTLSWESSNPDVLSDFGSYQRPYQPLTVTLTATIQLGSHTTHRTFDIDVAGYKSLSAPLASSYIYREYSSVTDSFFTTLDIINCAFIHADAQGELTGTAVLSNINAYIMPRARENGNWVLFSISPSSEWTEIAASATRINNFADNIVEMINTYGFDGVDIDWETPSPGEETRFTLMMQTIYTKVKENNPNHLVTAAIAGGMWQPPRYDLTNSIQYLDYVNMMTYGMVSNNGYYQNALYRSTSYAYPTFLAGKTLTSCSIAESIDIYHTYGIPNSKIIVGVAFYGIKQVRSYDSVSQTWSAWSNDGSVSFTYITNYYLNNSDYQYFFDTNAGVPYIVSTDGTVFISFDNPRSIAEKSEFILDNGLAGMMYWENGHDSTGTLLLAMDVGLNQ